MTPRADAASPWLSSVTAVVRLRFVLLGRSAACVSLSVARGSFWIAELS